jgi:membrane-associated protease RseP (regulator of RpoE activity)
MAVKKTPEAAAAKPARSRKVAEPEPTVEMAPPRDRTMFWALAFLAAAVVFGGGYLTGHAAADDDDEREFEGRGTIVMSDGSVMYPGDMDDMGMTGFVPGYPGDMHMPDMGMPGMWPMDPMSHGGMSGMVHCQMYPMTEPYPVPVSPPDPGTPGQVIEGQGYLGILGADTPGAVVIVEVEAGSPADQAGMVAGDRVISFAGTPVESMEQLADLVQGTVPGTEVEMVLGGPGGGRTVKVIVGERPGE